MAKETYSRLMSGRGSGDPFDRHLFACAIAMVLSSPGESLTTGLGLSEESLAALVGRHFPQAPGLLSGLSLSGHGDEALTIEEPDLRALLLEHRTRGLIEEEWLAHIVARRSLGANHLWQDLGLTSRADLSGLMRRHFLGLAELNSRDMKWKKFFYRELCQREGVMICKSPNCEVCTDYAHCFGAEDGVALLVAKPTLSDSVPATIV
ncbi:NifQ protein,Protein involved in biosynthesis of iron-molybdenum cofactor of nitrogenase [Magnetospirillum sp. XM-1]|uniref:nitrogen fixation protein NifQ n=1 Tax=Magnetospirillum sp. XM-1 TaxID=1663591 RepID=UPI00073E04B7|nr:nitrogen fixation protein NifQ [Magnetospirillum sp. XM-1]CUW41007.1 NifQ protein,Protein involved in biosynthesis of iron-molybdenum cofactor of nitrogenase [Magnetospirillum sp. XM-1]